jgi:hypothetical protein
VTTARVSAISVLSHPLARLYASTEFRDILIKNIESSFLLGILTAWADSRRSVYEDRPAAFAAIHHRLSQHPSNH